MKQWRSAGVVVAVDEAAQTIRIRDSQMTLIGVGIGFALTASAPLLIVRLRAGYSLTLSGWVTTATLALAALLCFWVQFRQAVNELTIDLANRTVECSSGSTFRTRRTTPLGDVTFTTRKTVTEVLGTSVEGVAVHVVSAEMDASILNFTADQESVVDGFTGILAGAAAQAPAHTLASFSAHAERLPPHMLGKLFGLVALMVGIASWAVARYVLQGP